MVTISVDPKYLLKKLNKFCLSSLTGAAELCVSRTHYEVSLEHFLLKALENPEADMVLILKHFDINSADVLKELYHTLEEFRSGNTRRPVYSPLLLEWIQDGWLIASVDLSMHEIRSAALLIAMLANRRQYTLGAYSNSLYQISLDQLRKDLSQILPESIENPVEPSEDRAEVKQKERAWEETALDKYTTNFTELARKGEIDPVLGRDREIRQMIDILARRRKNNPIVVGEAGVGKTALVEGLALKVVEQAVPDVLKNVEIMGLDLGLLQAGAGVKGEFENRLKSVIKEVKSSPQPIILFIDEAHTMIGAGGAAGGSDAANLLKPALARGELRTLAATTWTEYKKYFEKDPALTRRFQPVKLDEPSEKDAVIIIRGLKEKYEIAHNVYIREDAVQASVRLSSRYIHGRQLPDKAVDLLDTAAARVKVNLTSRPDALEDIDRRIQLLQQELKTHKRDQLSGLPEDETLIEEIQEQIHENEKKLITYEEKWQKEKELVEKIILLRTSLLEDTDKTKEHTDDKAKETQANKIGEIAENSTGKDEETKANNTEEIAENSTEESSEVTVEIGRPGAYTKDDLSAAINELKEIQGKEPLIHFQVDEEAVAKVIADWTGIPVGKMLRDEARALMELETRLKERIKGQSHALDIIAHVIRASKAGVGNPNAPLGVFLFVGPSGVGKTETGIAVADLLFGGERFMTTINMSEFQEKHTVSRLIGSPPGYVGYGEGGVLTEAVRQRPYSVVLLDEVEKADPEVMNLFYQVFDKGMLSDGEGRIINFKNTVIFMTSNLGSDVIEQMPSTASMEEVIALIRPLLSRHFKPALLARMTIVPYYKISSEVMRDIAILKLDQLAHRLKNSHNIVFNYDNAVLDIIVSRCTEVETGARNIDHIMNSTLLPAISAEILERMTDASLPEKLNVTLDDKGTFTFTFV
jgi:type VI secretion system protein VasG